MTPEIITTIATGVGTGLAGLFAGVIYVRKQLSSTQTQEARDSKERDIMSDLMHERDVASNEAAKVRSDLVTALQQVAQAEMGRRVMEGDFRNLTERYLRIKSMNTRLADRLVKAGLMDRDDMEFLVTRFSDLDEVPVPPPRPASAG